MLKASLEQGLEQAGLVEGVPALGKGVGMRGSFRSFPTNNSEPFAVIFVLLEPGEGGEWTLTAHMTQKESTISEFTKSSLLVVGHTQSSKNTTLVRVWPGTPQKWFRFHF